MVRHCLDGLPNEACGLLALDGDGVVEVYPTGNLDGSPVSYTVPPQEHFEALNDAEARGWRLAGAFHSHPTGPPRMSATDLEKALEIDWVYVVVGMSGGLTLTAWSEGREVDLVV